MEATESDPYRAEMMEFSNQEFKTIMITVLRILMEIVACKQEQWVF